MFGAPSSGKSMLMWTVALAIANGDRLVGEFRCRAGRVAIIEVDMPKNLYHERLTLSSARPTNGNVLHAITDAVPFDVLRVAATDVFVERVLAFEPILVIVDTLRKTHMLEENEAAVADRIYGKWRSLFPGVTLLFLHHTRKMPVGATFSEDVIVREAFRGNTAWAAGADTLMMLRRRDKGKQWRSELVFVRTRGCEEPAPMMLRRTDDLLLAPLEPTLTARLKTWLSENPGAAKLEAIGWLQGLANEHGEPLCSRSHAYRIYTEEVESPS